MNLAYTNFDKVPLLFEKHLDDYLFVERGWDVDEKPYIPCIQFEKMISFDHVLRIIFDEYGDVEFEVDRQTCCKLSLELVYDLFAVLGDIVGIFSFKHHDARIIDVIGSMCIAFRDKKQNA